MEWILCELASMNDNTYVSVQEIVLPILSLHKQREMEHEQVEKKVCIKINVQRQINKLVHTRQLMLKLWRILIDKESV